MLLAANFGRPYGPAAAQVSAADWAALECFGRRMGMAVPEPVGLSALAVVGVLLLRRRKPQMNTDAHR